MARGAGRESPAGAGPLPAFAGRRSPAGAGPLPAFAGVTCLLALVQVFTVAAGLFRVPLGRALAAGLLAAAVALSVVFARMFANPRASGTATGRPAAGAGGIPRMLATLLGAAAVAWAAWVWVELWIMARLRPPYDWDGLYYHVPAIHEWVMAGRVSFLDHLADIPFVNFPMGVELSVLFAHQLTGASWIVNACNLWYWPLAFLALAVIAHRLGARGVWPWAAGALLTGAPVFVSQSVSCYIDPGFAASVMAAVAAAAVFVFDDGRSRRASPVLLGMAVGLALGSKGTGVPFAVVIVLLSVGWAAWLRGVKRWRRWVPRACAVLLVAFVVGGYWYARNAGVTGNPVYPIQIKFGDKVIKQGYDYVQFNEANLPPWLEKYPAPLRMFVSWLETDAPISGYAPVGGMGYVWPAAALPALLYLWVLVARRRYPGRTREFVFVTVLALVLLAVQPSPWWSRFTIWLHALGLPAIAVVAWHSASSWQRSRWHAVPLVLAAAAVCLAIWESGRTLDLEWDNGRTTEAVGVHARFKSSLDYMLPGMAESPGFDRFLAADVIARGPWERYGTLLGGILALPLDKREISVLPMNPTPGDVSALRRDGVQWVIWDAVAAGDPPGVLAEAAGEHHAFNPAPDVDFHIIRLDGD
jgi:hypothetical protein